MRLLQFSLFLTFVWYSPGSSAPLIEPIPSKPVTHFHLNETKGEDIEIVTPSSRQLHLGYLAGNIFSTSDTAANWFLGYAQKRELEFEKYYLIGVLFDFNKNLGISIRSDLKSLNLVYFYPLENIEIGLAHFINSNEGVSNLVNINHTKISVGYSFFKLITLNTFYGFYGFSSEAHFSICF